MPSPTVTVLSTSKHTACALRQLLICADAAIPCSILAKSFWRETVRKNFGAKAWGSTVELIVLHFDH
jgi:hypothetical protein